MNTVFFTGTGDGGESEVGKKKIEKDHPVIALLGSLDELNSILGWCSVNAQNVPSAHQISCSDILMRIQELLFIAQAEIAGIFFEYPTVKKINSAHVAYVEAIIKKIDKILPPLKQFVLPGGCELSARIDIARAVSRRVERDAISTSKKIKISDDMKAFLNRLSSILFALARYVNHVNNISERHPSYE